MTQTAPVPTNEPTNEQAVHDVGTGQVVVNRTDGAVDVTFTGRGPFRIARELRDVFRAIFDRADEAEQAVKDTATAIGDEAQAIVEAPVAPTVALRDAAAGADEGILASHEWAHTAGDVAADAHARNAGEAVPAETAAPAAETSIETRMTALETQLGQILSALQAGAVTPAPATDAATSPLAGIPTAAPSTGTAEAAS